MTGGEVPPSRGGLKSTLLVELHQERTVGFN